MKVTRAMVAKHANVSPQTVSYYLNQSRSVSPELQKRIQASIECLGYTPDMIATSMVKNETKTIGVIMNDLANPLDGEIVKSLQVAALKRGYFINIFGFGDVEIKTYISNIIARRVDAIYITAIPTKFQEQDLQRLSENGIRVLTSVNRIWKRPDVGHIDPDFMQGMRDVLRHLFDLGHRDIAYLSAFDDSYPFDNRLEAFRNAVAACGLPAREDLIVQGARPYSTAYRAGAQLTKTLLQRKKHFTAVVATNDLMAFAAMNMLRESGLRVPEDVSVVGIDDIYLAEGMQLTTVGYDKELFAEKIFDMLYDSIKNNVYGECDVAMRLIPRKSTAKINQKVRQNYGKQSETGV